LGLPSFVDKDRIGVNLGRIDRLQRLAGIKQLTVTGQMFDQTSGVDVQIVGMNPDGSAMAGKGGSKTTIPTYESHPLVANDRVPMSQRQINLNITANLDEIASRLTDSKDGVRSPKGWARELDNGVRQSIKKAGTANLLRNMDHSTKFRYKFLVMWNAGYEILGRTLISHNSAQEIPVHFASGMLIGSMLYSLIEFVEQRKNPKYRKSLFLGMQLDRAVALRALTLSQKLIKDLRPDKK